MTFTYMLLAGMGTGYSLAEGLPSSLPATVSFDATVGRSNAQSLKIAPASGTNNSMALTTQGTPGSIYNLRFYVRVDALPATTARVLIGNPTNASNIDQQHVRLNTSGTLSLFNDATTLAGTSTASIGDGAWHCVEVVTSVSGTTFGTLYIDNVSQVTGNAGDRIMLNIGADDTVADTYTVHIESLIVAANSGSGSIGLGSTILLPPISDNSVGSGWTTSGASSSNLWTNVDSYPPIGIADTTTNEGHQIRNATSATASYVANMLPYASAGIVSGDTIRAVWGICTHASIVVTGAKTGSLQITANPADAAALAFSHGSGSTADYWQGNAAGTFPTGWAQDFTTINSSPGTPTLTTSPTLSLNITGGTASRIAICCMLAMYVESTHLPGPIPPHTLFLRQAVKLAATR